MPLPFWPKPLIHVDDRDQGHAIHHQIFNGQPKNAGVQQHHLFGKNNQTKTMKHDETVFIPDKWNPRIERCWTNLVRRQGTISEDGGKEAGTALA